MNAICSRGQSGELGMLPSRWPCAQQPVIHLPSLSLKPAFLCCCVTLGLELCTVSQAPHPAGLLLSSATGRCEMKGKQEEGTSFFQGRQQQPAPGSSRFQYSQQHKACPARRESTSSPRLPPNTGAVPLLQVQVTNRFLLLTGLSMKHRALQASGFW